MEANPAVAPAAVEEVEGQASDESQEVSLEEKEKEQEKEDEENEDQEPEKEQEKGDEEKEKEQEKEDEEPEKEQEKDKEQEKEDPPAAELQRVEDHGLSPEEIEKRDKQEELEQAAQDLFDKRVKEEPLSEDESEGLVLQDVRWCQKCKSKSYLRQGLCINLYCPLYYMNRPDANVRLTARGRLSEGKKWSPKEWKDSGAWEQVEENLLASEFKEALADVKDFGPPPLLAAKPKVVAMPSRILKVVRWKSTILSSLHFRSLHLVRLQQAWKRHSKIWTCKTKYWMQAANRETKGGNV